MVKNMLLICVIILMYSCSAGWKKGFPVINLTGGGGDTGGGNPSSNEAWDGTTEQITANGNLYEIHNAKQLAWVATQSEGFFNNKTVRFIWVTEHTLWNFNKVSKHRQKHLSHKFSKRLTCSFCVLNFIYHDSSSQYCLTFLHT